MADDKPIIIIKKKGGHGGHHGGAWKVAYADFVTAMMAFFMVMWLVNSAEVSTRESIARYFRRPGIFAEGSGTPLEVGGAGILADAFTPPKPDDNTGTNKVQEGIEEVGTPKPTPIHIYTPEPGKGKEKEGEKAAQGNTGAGELNKGQGVTQSKNEGTMVAPGGEKTSGGKSAAEVEKAAVESLANQIRTQISGSEALSKLLGIVDVKVEADGLNIEIMDSEKGSMFALGNARVLPEAMQAFEKLGTLLKQVPNKIDIVGHTDSKPFSNRIGGYSNWELSADRANAARKLLEISGIGPERITSVVGRADKELRNKADAYDATNRRISLKMRFNFSKSVDLAKNPSALSDLDKFEREAAAEEVAKQAPTAPASEEAPLIEAPIPGVPTSPPPTLQPIIDKTHKFTPEKLIKAAQNAEVKVKLPDEDTGAAASSGSGSGSKKDKIFGDSPVIGPGDPFGGP